jgi:hypothetical protein
MTQKKDSSTVESAQQEEVKPPQKAAEPGKKPPMLSRILCGASAASLRVYMPSGDHLVAFGTFLLAAATAWLAFVASKTDEATHELAKASSEQVKIIHDQLEEMKAAREQTEKLIKSAQDSADIARRTLAIGQRPWVYPELVTDGRGLVFKDGFMVLGAKLILRNVGNSPAINVNFYTRSSVASGLTDLFPEGFQVLGLQLFAPSQAASAALLRTFCEQNSQKVKELGDAIFPDRESVRSFLVRVPEKEIAEKEMPGIAIWGPRPIVIVCLTYRSAADREIHRTGYVFGITKKDGSSISVGGTTAADQIEFTPYFNAGSIAD